MKKVIDNAAVPKGGTWVYVHGETGFTIRHPYFNQIMVYVKEFFKANNYPITANFADEVEQNLCEHASEGVCMDWTPPTLMEKMSSVARALAKLGNSKREPLVSAETLEMRRSICETCNFYGGSRSLIKIACRRCGCAGLSLALKIKACPHNPPKWLNEA